MDTPGVSYSKIRVLSATAKKRQASVPLPDMSFQINCLAQEWALSPIYFEFFSVSV